MGGPFTARLRMSSGCRKRCKAAALSYGSIKLSDLLVHRGRADDAGRWYRRVVEEGHRVASERLPRLLTGQGRMEEAADTGDPGALTALGHRLIDEDRLEEGRFWAKHLPAVTSWPPRPSTPYDPKVPRSSRARRRVSERGQIRLESDAGRPP